MRCPHSERKAAGTMRRGVWQGRPYESRDKQPGKFHCPRKERLWVMFSSCVPLSTKTLAAPLGVLEIIGNPFVSPGGAGPGWGMEENAAPQAPPRGKYGNLEGARSAAGNEAPLGSQINTPTDRDGIRPGSRPELRSFGKSKTRTALPYICAQVCSQWQSIVQLTDLPSIYLRLVGKVEVSVCVVCGKFPSNCRDPI
eukprot:gene18797-biopygen16000